jgi:DNA-binding FadR family transcriptional regulator
MKKLEKTSLVEEVLAQLKENIVEGIWPPNTLIPSEPALSRQFRVSRNTVRSSVQELCAHGILVKRQGYGTLVAENLAQNILTLSVPRAVFSRKELIDTLEFRRTIELESVSLACRRRTEEDLVNLQECAERLTATVGDPEAFVLADYGMHACIAKASGNIIFHRSMVRLEDIILQHMREAVALTDIKRSCTRHIKIVAAIKQRQGARAKKIMAEHFNVLIDVVEDHN